MGSPSMSSPDPEQAKPPQPKPSPTVGAPTPPPPFQGQTNPAFIGMPSMQAGVAMLQANVWNGPFPPPEAVQLYEKTLPGAFDRILTMSEKRQAAEIEISLKSTDAAIADAKRGNYMGFIVTLVALVGGLELVFRGRPIAGLTIILVYGICAGLSFFMRKPVGVFTQNKQNQHQEKPQK